jgi:cysteine desulfurase / selenocysteine lyase
VYSSDIQALVRDEFNANGTYLNAASFGLVPRSARQAVFSMLERKASGQVEPADFQATLSAARTMAARLIGARPEEIALTTNTTHALHTAAGLLVARQRAGHAGRTVIVSRGEFPANVYPWRALDIFGFRVEFVDTDAHGFPDQDALEHRVGHGDVAALALSSVQFATGFRADLPRLGRACQAVDALFIVDAIQQVGAEPVDVRDAAIDLLAAGAQKWLCSPFGTGFLYVRDELTRSLPPLQPGWLAFESSWDLARMTDYDTRLLGDARRYEVGTLPLHDVAGFAAAAELLLQAGTANTAAHLAGLRTLLVEAADRAGVSLASPRDDARASAIVCLEVPDADGLALRLLERGVTCSAREGRLRVSPHLYNTASDIEDLLAAMDVT